jgi:hypothetical protein
MKHMIFPLIASLLLCPLSALATETGESSETSYDYTQTYDGRFESDRLYQQDSKEMIWISGCGDIKQITEINCYQALNSLHESGFWTGNLSREGECLGSEEAPERTYGNYLNYVHQKFIHTSIPTE